MKEILAVTVYLVLHHFYYVETLQNAVKEPYKSCNSYIYNIWFINKDHEYEIGKRRFHTSEVLKSCISKYVLNMEPDAIKVLLVGKIYYNCFIPSPFVSYVSPKMLWLKAKFV